MPTAASTRPSIAMMPSTIVRKRSGAVDSCTNTSSGCARRSGSDASIPPQRFPHRRHQRRRIDRGPDHERDRHAGVVVLRPRQIQRRLRRLRHAHVGHIVHHADDGQRRRVGCCGAGSARSDRRPAAARSANRRLTIATCGRSATSSSVKARPPQRLDLHRLEVVGADAAELHGMRLAVRRRPVFDVDQASDTRSPARTRSASCSAETTPGSARMLVEHPLHHGGARSSGVLIGGVGQPDLRGQTRRRIR